MASTTTRNDDLNILGGPLDPDPEDPSRATSLQACCFELLWKAGLFFGFVFGFFKLAQDVSGLYLLAFALVIGVGVAVQSYVGRQSRLRLLAEYRLVGEQTNCTIIQRFVKQERPHHHSHRSHQSGHVSVQETKTSYFMRCRYQAHVPVGYQRRDGVIVEDDDTDALVEHAWGVGRDLYYTDSTELDLYYLPHEPKSGIPQVFLDPSVGDAGRSEIPMIIVGVTIALVPLALVIMLGSGSLSSTDYLALAIDIAVAAFVGLWTYRHFHRISYTRVRQGERAQIVGWVPSDHEHQAQSCSVPQEGEDDYGPTVSLQLGPNSGISMVVPPATTHRVGYSQEEVVVEENEGAFT